MDIIGKILQALLGGDRPRTWIDLLIVLAVCSTYALTQALRFVHHQRQRQAAPATIAHQFSAAVGSADPVPAPKATASLVVLILAVTGLSGARLDLGDTDRIRGAARPFCFVRNRSGYPERSACMVPATLSHRKDL